MANVTRRELVAGGATALVALGATPSIAEMPATPVVELRQYKIVHGKRETFIPLFEREFVDSQEALGMRLVGQFRDTDDSDRFTWIREFPSFDARAGMLGTFYYGPVWHAHRDQANPLLDDNDNVLLLKPAGPDTGFGRFERREGGPDRGLVMATIHYLWKAPEEGFAAFFEAKARPALEAAGLPVLGAFVTEGRPNDFPRLPVRQSEKVFVWFTRVADETTYARGMTAFRGDAGVRRGAEWLIPDLEERPAQLLRLKPTPRSRLRAS